MASKADIKPFFSLEVSNSTMILSDWCSEGMEVVKTTNYYEHGTSELQCSICKLKKSSIYLSKPIIMKFLTISKLVESR